MFQKRLQSSFLGRDINSISVLIEHNINIEVIFSLFSFRIMRSSYWDQFWVAFHYSIKTADQMIMDIDIIGNFKLWYALFIPH